jgi:hypothetical protein
MIQQAGISETPQAVPDETPRPEPAPSEPSLEERVQRLEQIVASLQDTHALEERVAERVTAQVSTGGGNGVRESVGLLVEAGRQVIPAAVGVLADAGRSSGPRPVATPATRPPWLLVDIWAEGRAIVRMYLDRRFRLSWQARILPIILIAAIATSWIWIPGTAILPSFISSLIVKAVDLVLALVLFKVLHREVTRYRATSPDGPGSLRP